jgi:hypothetical protein
MNLPKGSASKATRQDMSLTQNYTKVSFQRVEKPLSLCFRHMLLSELLLPKRLVTLLNKLA